MTYVIIVFVVWRVESLQKLPLSSEKGDTNDYNSNLKSLNIKQLLVQHCENTKLYLHHDLSLDYLCHAIGTNHYYLSQYFSQQGITYNTYINTLRIDHFMSIYPTMRAEYKTAQQIADASGFKSYSTFSAAFKRIKGQTFKEWISTLS
jgi:YesN/AraC family two-component response regulator